jgi:regulator of RNase E activity RraA
VTVCPGDWVFGDDNGVLVIPGEHLEEVIRRAENVENTERKIIGAINGGTSLDVASPTAWLPCSGSESMTRQFFDYWAPGCVS